MFRRVALLAALTALCFSSSAGAQPTLSLPVDLSSVGKQSAGISIALSSDGSRATALWREESSIGKYRVRTCSATIAGGVASWGPVSVLSAAGGHVSSAEIRLSADGSEAVAIWTNTGLTPSTVVESSAATIVGNTASWGSVTRVSDPSVGGSNPRLVLSGDGTRAFAVWERSAAGSCAVVVGSSAVISGTAASWGSVQQISESGGCIQDASAASSSSGGLVTIVWSSAASAGTRIVRARSGIVSGSGTTPSWGSITDLSAPGFYSKNPAVVVSADGTKATVAWARASVDKGRAVRPVLIRSRSATISGQVADWGPTTILSSTTDSSGSPRLAASSDGALVAASWIRSDASTWMIESAEATVSGNSASWGAVTNVSGAGQTIRGHSLSVSGNGSKVLSTWHRAAASNLVVQGASAVVNGQDQLWVPVFDISAPTPASSQSTSVVSADGEVALLGWAQSNGAGRFVSRASVAEFAHPTPTPTPVATSTPTSTPTPAPTVTPVGTQLDSAPNPSASSNDLHVILRIRVHPANFRRHFYGYLVRASDHQLVKMGKFRVRNHRGRLEFHDVPPGVYVTYTVVIRTKAPKVVSSRFKTITVK